MAEVKQNLIRTIIQQVAAEITYDIAQRGEATQVTKEALALTVRQRLIDAGVPVQRRRTAVILDDSVDDAVVADYLPSNYSSARNVRGQIEIEGFDNAGCTLDGYVIPRLCSGLISAIEVFDGVA